MLLLKLMDKALGFMLQAVAKVDDVGNCHYMMVTFYQLALQLSKCWSTCLVLTLISD